MIIKEVNKILEITSRKGAVYFRSDYDGSWWRRKNTDDCRGNFFIGAEYNLPKEILKKLKKH